MESRRWEIRDVIRLSPDEVLRSVLMNDTLIYLRAASDFAPDIELLDDALTLYIKLLQQAHYHRDKWIHRDNLRASVAMANSMLDFGIF